MSNIPFLNIILATTDQLGIGYKNTLPWPRLKEDLNLFKRLTLDGIVIMGRNTWLSLPKRPLPNRINIVVTSTLSGKLEMDESKELYDRDLYFVSTVEEALVLSRTLTRTSSCKNESINETRHVISKHSSAILERQVFVMGGAQLYNRVLLKYPYLVKRIYETVVLGSYRCDTFLHKSVFDQFTITERHEPVIEKTEDFGTIVYQTVILEKRHEERQYFDWIQSILDAGNRKGNRTGIWAQSSFGFQAKYNLREHFPLLTSKQVFWKGVLKELLWFLRGCTDAQVLNDSPTPVKIWNGNSCREALDKLAEDAKKENDMETYHFFKHLIEMDCGAAYGFQWRHWGAKYKDCKTDYTGQGVDQIANLIHTLKKNPADRRMILTTMDPSQYPTDLNLDSSVNGSDSPIVSGWNPSQLNRTCLPCCHCLSQFYVSTNIYGEKELSCILYQRSNDVFLGCPFNISSYAALTYMLAHVCDMIPGDFIHFSADTHIYSNHMDAVREQMKQEIRTFPKLVIKRKVDKIEDFTMDDFELVGYTSAAKIKADMAT